MFWGQAGHRGGHSPGHRVRGITRPTEAGWQWHPLSSGWLASQNCQGDGAGMQSDWLGSQLGEAGVIAEEVGVRWPRVLTESHVQLLLGKELKENLVLHVCVSVNHWKKILVQLWGYSQRWKYFLMFPPDVGSSLECKTKQLCLPTSPAELGHVLPGQLMFPFTDQHLFNGRKRIHLWNCKCKS